MHLLKVKSNKSFAFLLWPCGAARTITTKLLKSSIQHHQAPRPRKPDVVALTKKKTVAIKFKLFHVLSISESLTTKPNERLYTSMTVKYVSHPERKELESRVEENCKHVPKQGTMLPKSSLRRSYHQS